MKYEQTTGELSGVNLLVSLLVRFPEILTIHYNLAETVFKFSFMLDVELAPERYKVFKKNFNGCLKAYYQMLQLESVTLQINKKPVKAWTLLQIIFHKKSISFEEINLVSALIINEFNQELIVDTRGNSCLTGDRGGPSEDFIECLLPERRNQEKKENLFAFREAGKVYVFDQ